MAIPRYTIKQVDGDRDQEWHVTDVLSPTTYTNRAGERVPLEGHYETVCVCYEPETADQIAERLNREPLL